MLDINIDCEYYNLENMSNLAKDTNTCQYMAIHLNIRGLAGKFDQLTTMISNINAAGLKISFILLCETFLNDINYSMYSIPG